MQIEDSIRIKIILYTLLDCCWVVVVVVVRVATTIDCIQFIEDLGYAVEPNHIA